MWSYNHLSSDELYHYGVLGMKWGVRRAKKNGTTYSYKSHATKMYEKKSSKAEKKGDLDKAKRYSKYAKRSSELDRKMQDYAESVSAGKAAAQLLLVNSRHYSVGKLASGNSKYLSRGIGLATTFMHDFGEMGVRALYVRGYDDRTIDRVKKNVSKALKK